MKNLPRASWSLALGFVLAVPSFAALPKSVGTSPSSARAEWRLPHFLRLAESDPARLIRVSNLLISEDRIRQASADATKAFDWQHRVAAMTALSAFFDPDPQISKHVTGTHRREAREILQKTLASDPSLLVRDAVVESLRRILRMQPGEAKLWKRSLETAFLDRKNVIQGEGLFIRETILTALREGSMKPSSGVWAAAKRDKSAPVRNVLHAWDTSAYDSVN